jgi:hypothetical protein
MSHRFVSWIRTGAAAARTDAKIAGANPTAIARVSIDGAPHDVAVTLHGPGDVAGLSASAIVRRDPVPDALGVSPAGMPFVELSPADLPWRFSPAPTPAVRDKIVMPWLALVVVPATVPYGPEDRALLPVLTVSRKELPDPAELWAWAHVQIEEPEGGLTEPVGAYLRAHPDRAIARLIAPRRLDPQAKYRACLVPVYEAGRRAALGEPDVAKAGDALAWKHEESNDTIRLPVYDTWLIETGNAADFETIARRMHGDDADKLFTPMTVDIAAALARTEPVHATMYGLLRPEHGEDELPEPMAIAKTLAPWLVTDASDEPAVGPPLYGAAQAAARLADAVPWQITVNLDPRRRAQAAAGAAVVRADQEALVADARAAIGQLDRANAIVRGTQLATLLSDRLHARHIAPRPPGRIVAMLWPTLAGTEVAAAAAPAASAGLLSASLRRMARPAGPLARGRVAGMAWARLHRDVTLAIKPVPLDPATTMTMSSVRAAPPPAGPATPPAVHPHGMVFGHLAVPVEHTATLAVPAVPAVATFAMPAERLAELRTEIAARLATPMRTVTVAPVAALDTGAIAARALAASAPIAIAKRLAARIQGVGLVAELVQLTEVKPALDLSRPLADRLAVLQPTLFLPGLAKLPPDTVAALTVDPAAVEAILAGANDELMRELAWRGIALDRRATLLRQMWARPARDPSGHDVPPMAEWTGELGTHATSAPTVFVIRSELVRRFPTAAYAVARAVPDAKLGRKVGDQAVVPLFRGLAAPDVAYVGFAASLATLAGASDWKPGATSDPGWYLTIQERPGHTRFGLDAVTQADTEPPEWVNLSWAEVTANPYLRLGEAPARNYPTTPGPAWKQSAAAMAAIVERPAVRIAIHVQELLAHG